MSEPTLLPPSPSDQRRIRSSGKLKKVVIIDSDVTLRKEAEEKVREFNKDILDSIHYAKRIQQSLLTSEKYIERNLRRLMENKNAKE